MFFDDHHPDESYHWHFFYNYHWNRKFPALLAGIGPARGPKGGYYMFWRGKVWVFNSADTPSGGPQWVGEIEESRISRDEAKALFPDAFAVSHDVIAHTWDLEHVEEIIAGTYPPPIPDRYGDFPEHIELVNRFERGEKLLLEFLDFSEHRFDRVGPPNRLTVWLERLSPDELADLFLVFKAMQKGFIQKRYARDGQEFHMKELESALRIIVNWRYSESLAASS
jgi:hypothetical protein